MVGADILLINFFFGLLSAFSPCLFPLLPSYVAMTLKNKTNRFMTFLSSLSLILGVVVVFLLIGQVLNLVDGFLLKNYSTFAKIQGSLLVIAGIILIKPPAFITSITLPQRIQDRVFSDEARNPLLFSFIIGLVFTVIAAPCASGYFLVVFNSMIGQSFIGQTTIVIVFALGVGLPFMLSSLVVDEFRGDLVGTIHQTTDRLGIILGVILIMVGVWLFMSVTPTGISQF